MEEHQDRLRYRMTTYTGRHVRPFGLNATDVCLRDLAHSLARICRFGGHVQVEDSIYSVAEHSVRASWCFPEAPVRVQLAILLHDGHEAYLGDWIRPVKQHPAFDLLKPYVDRTQDAILQHFGLDVEEGRHSFVKRADEIMAWTEFRDLMAPMPAADVRVLNDISEQPLTERIVPWSIRESRIAFEKRAQELLDAF